MPRAGSRSCNPGSETTAPVERDGEVVVPTPVHAVLSLHAPQRGGTAVRMSAECASAHGVPLLSGSVSIVGHRLTLAWSSSAAAR